MIKIKSLREEVVKACDKFYIKHACIECPAYNICANSHYGVRDMPDYMVKEVADALGILESYDENDKTNIESKKNKRWGTSMVFDKNPKKLNSKINDKLRLLNENLNAEIKDIRVSACTSVFLDFHENGFMATITYTMD